MELVFTRKRWIILAGLVLAALLLIYSGTAWLLFKPLVHKETVNQYAGVYKMDPLWILSIIRVESRFIPKAKSHRGAVGLMQLLPSTAQQLAEELHMPKLSEEQLNDPDVNIRLGIYYLSKLDRKFSNEVAVLAAYNAGPGIVSQWVEEKHPLTVENIPYPETKRFVQTVQQTYTALKWIQRWKHWFGIFHEQR